MTFEAVFLAEVFSLLVFHRDFSLSIPGNFLWISCWTKLFHRAFFSFFFHLSPFRPPSILMYSYLLPRTRAVTLTRQNISYSRFLS